MPMVLLKSPPAPLPVLLFAVLVKSVTLPTAALNLPWVLLLRENKQTAVLNVPLVRSRRAPLFFRCVSPA